MCFHSIAERSTGGSKIYPRSSLGIRTSSLFPCSVCPGKLGERTAPLSRLALLTSGCTERLQRRSHNNLVASAGLQPRSHYVIISTLLSLPLRAKYSFSHPVLKHPQLTFLPQCERPSFIPIQNNRQNYSSVYLINL